MTLPPRTKTALGLVAGRVQHHQQRRRAGLKGGRRYRAALFPFTHR